MTTARFLIRSIFYYWRTNLAILLGVVAATAVIGGALIVGDSVQQSLRAMSLKRLGDIDHVLTGERFFREELAADLREHPEFQKRFEQIAPAILMEGSLTHTHSGNRSRTARANQVQIFGTDKRLWNMTEHGDTPLPSDREVVLNSRTAEQLNVQPGDEVTLWIEIPSSIPRDTLLGKRDQMTREATWRVASILDDQAGLGRLSLNPHQQLPLNAFVSLNTLQRTLGLAEVPRSRRNPEGAPARVNSLFVSSKRTEEATGSAALEAAQELSSWLSMPESLKLDDLHLNLRQNEDRQYLSLESERMLLESPLVEAARSAIADLQRRFGGNPENALSGSSSGIVRSPVLVYLANEISNPEQKDAYSMYSIVAGSNFNKLDRPPFGPFKFVGDPPASLGEGNIESGGVGEIVINEWLAEDLKVQVGDVIQLKYHLVGSHGELPEEERTFRVKGIAKLDGTPADDRFLTPVVKGITDAQTFGEWDEPFPMEMQRITERDETYWDRYRATPKAFVTLETAQHLWSSRYGELTSFRVSKVPGKSLEESARLFEDALIESLEPEKLGLVFRPVKYNGLQAASGTTDFSGLFLAFSFFLILSATILINLLFRLGIERRSENVGLLSAVGLSGKKVRRLFLVEGMTVVLVGGLLGTAAAVGYGSLMVYVPKDWWRRATGAWFLDLYVEPASLIIGLMISVVVAFVAVWWGIRYLRRLSTRDLLSGVTQKALTTQLQQQRGRRALTVASGSFLLAMFLLVAAIADLIPSNEAFSGLSWQVVTFFVVGIALLVSSLSFLAAWLDADRQFAVRGRGISAVARLGLRNASRHRQRSVLTVGLIASATFVIVAVASGHRNPAIEKPEKNSGNGGFTLVAESSTPVLYNLNTPEGRSQLNFNVEEGTKEAGLLEQMQVIPFRLRPGDDASCLNLYKVQVPTILGVPEKMIQRGGFQFADTPSAKPWTLLNKEYEDGAVPVLGDMNTLMWSLKKGIGDTIPLNQTDRDSQTLRVAGMLKGSVFQNALLMSEDNFRKLFPDQTGYRYFLIEISPEHEDELALLLETELTEYGFAAELVGDRLKDYLAVQNTYLSTFQLLGGLGLLLGTLGLSTVMLRNVLERRSELALLRAVGFRNFGLAVLVLWENSFLLLWGLVAGTVSALLAMTPHLLSVGADVPWTIGGIILGSVFLVGMAAAFLAVFEAVRTPILNSLRTE